jgi:hypothetical protein
MRKLYIYSLIVMFALALGTGVSYAGSKHKMKYAVGDEVYACACPETCPCDYLANKAGKCNCGADLAKATVSKVEKGKVMVKMGDKELTFKTKSKYACACGETCKCGSMSQKEGKCVCNMDMKEVKKKKKKA